MGSDEEYDKDYEERYFKGIKSNRGSRYFRSLTDTEFQEWRELGNIGHRNLSPEDRKLFYHLNTIMKGYSSELRGMDFGNITPEEAYRYEFLGDYSNRTSQANQNIHDEIGRKLFPNTPRQKVKLSDRLNNLRSLLSKNIKDFSSAAFNTTTHRKEKVIFGIAVAMLATLTALSAYGYHKIKKRRRIKQEVFESKKKAKKADQLVYLRKIGSRKSKRKSRK